MFDAPRHYVSPRTWMLGMVVFLISLGMLFGASMIGFLLINFAVRRPRTVLEDGQWVTITPNVPGLHLPWGLWVSTAVIMLSSLTIHQALRNVQFERQRRFRRWMAATLVLAVGFVAVQAPCMVSLLESHGALRETKIALYGFVFALILIHALHVLGGLIPMFIITLRAYGGHYDHENYSPVRAMVLYWHFLDGVWLVMFAVLLATV